MTTFKKFVEVFPDDLFHRLPAFLGNRQWEVLQVTHNFTGKVTIQLHAREVPFYCPYYHSRHRWSDRWKELDMPLFPEYIFVLGTSEERKAAIRASKYIKRVLRDADVGDQNRLTGELTVIRAITRAGRLVSPDFASNLVGDQIEISSGPFLGHRGRVLESKSGFRFVVGVETLKLRASVELDRDQFRRL